MNAGNPPPEDQLPQDLVEVPATTMVLQIFHDAHVLFLHYIRTFLLICTVIFVLRWCDNILAGVILDMAGKKSIAYILCTMTPVVLIYDGFFIPVMMFVVNVVVRDRLIERGFSLPLSIWHGFHIGWRRVCTFGSLKWILVSLMHIILSSNVNCFRVLIGRFSGYDLKDVLVCVPILNIVNLDDDEVLTVKWLIVDVSVRLFSSILRWVAIQTPEVLGFIENFTETIKVVVSIPINLIFVASVESMISGSVLSIFSTREPFGAMTMFSSLLLSFAEVYFFVVWLLVYLLATKRGPA